MYVNRKLPKDIEFHPGVILKGLWGRSCMVANSHVNVRTVYRFSPCVKLSIARADLRSVLVTRTLISIGCWAKPVVNVNGPKVITVICTR